MSTDRPDDLDDVPTLHPLPADDREALERDYGEPPLLPPRRPAWLPEPKPGFGFWMAVVWCLFYFVVMQFIGAIVVGVPAIIVAMVVNQMNGRPVPVDVPGMMNDPAMGTALLVILIGSHLIGLLFGWIILRWQVGRHWKRRIALSRRPTLTHAALVLIGFPAMLTLSAAVEQPIARYVPSLEDLLRQLGVPFDWPGIEAMMPLLQRAPWPLALLAVAVLPAINEEFWTRGFLGQGLQARYRAWVAVLIVSFLFGCLHVDTRQGLGAMLLGAVIYGAYLATRSLWVAMGIHFLNNGLAVVHMNDHLFPVLKPLEDGLDRNPALYIAGAALLFAAVAYALYQTRCKLVPEMEGLPTWRPKGVGGVELPPPGSGTVVTHAPLSALSAALVVVGAVAFGLVLALA
jgi:uncharacterized protein